MRLPLRTAESGPRLAENDRILLVPDPPGEAPQLTECHIVHLDDATGRLIVTCSEVNDAVPAAVGAPVLALVVRPGEPVFAQHCSVEARLEAARWLVLGPTSAWEQIKRRLVERTEVTLPVSGHRYTTAGIGLRVSGTIRNLSMTGFLVESDSRVGLSDLLVLDCVLPNDEVIQIRGQAVRVVSGPAESPGSWSVGCQFWGLRQADQQRIARLIAQSTRSNDVDHQGH